MRQTIRRTLLALLFALGTVAAHAGEPAPYIRREFKPIDAEGQIAACREKSRQLVESTGTEANRAGFLDISLCLRDAIIDAYGEMFSDNDFTGSDGKKTQYNIRDEVESLRGTYGRLMWRIYNDHDGCFCGTMWQSQHNLETVKLFEGILRLMAAQQEHYPPKTPNPEFEKQQKR